MSAFVLAVLPIVAALIRRHDWPRTLVVAIPLCWVAAILVAFGGMGIAMRTPGLHDTYIVVVHMHDGLILAGVLLVVPGLFLALRRRGAAAFERLRAATGLVVHAATVMAFLPVILVGFGSGGPNALGPWDRLTGPGTAAVAVAMAVYLALSLWAALRRPRGG